VAIEPTLIERSAHTGTLDDATPVALATRLPATIAANVGGLSLSVSSSLTGELKDAFQYLVDYPYGCIEQTSSRVLSLVAARQLGQRFELDAAEAQRRLTAGLERIASMQTESGGFAYWPEQTTVHPYATGFATWVLLLAQESGATVPKRVLERALDYLAEWTEKGGKTDTAEWYFFGDPATLFPTERAMALFVLAEANRPLPKAALDEALSGREALPAFVRALLVATLARSADPRLPTLVAELLALASELPATAHLREIETARWDYLFHSQGRSDAMALFALLAAKPDHPLVAKLARGLLDGRTAGRWRNTQENAYSLLALLAYARTFETERPEFTVNAWAGERPILEKRLNATLPSAETFVPMARLQALPQPVPIIVQRQGQGRLYYRLGTEWADANGAAPPRDQGLSIERTIRTRRGAFSLQAGEAVAFDLTLKTRAPLGFVAVEVPLPGGLEPVLDNLGKGHDASRLGSGYRITTYEERLPDRVRLFFDRLNAGEHQITVELRATTPGDFALPPARAEAMYMPEVYGRSTGGRVTVTAP
jgi:uncharacterized protein YfaS (alpha-2-macroglobulin family)